MEWRHEGEQIAHDCWAQDDDREGDLQLDDLENAHLDATNVASSGTTLGASSLSTMKNTVIDEFDARSYTTVPGSVNSCVVRSLSGPQRPTIDLAEDLDFIGEHLGLDIDDERRLLSTAAGRREWIRREMLRREDEFSKRTSLSIAAGTWNVNGKKPSVDLRAWLLSRPRFSDSGARSNTSSAFFPKLNGDVIDNSPDVYVLSLQEVQPLSGVSAVTTDTARGLAWKAAVERALDAPNAYVTIAARQMVGILLIVAVKRCHEPFVREVMLTDAGTGFMRTGGNKGGVACRFALYDKTIAVVSCHFAAHEYNVERRNQDFHEIMRKSVFRPEPGAATEPYPFSYLDHQTGENPSQNRGPITLLDHDVIFWTGDLNYRIQLPPDKVLNLIQSQEWDQLRKFDQLENVRQGGDAFQGFEEGDLHFAPTYKLERYGTGYEMREDEEQLKRTPSWTDRILWRDRVKGYARSITPVAGLPGPLLSLSREDGMARSDPGGVVLKSYRRHELLSSDHRPVSADFSLEFRVINVRRRNEVVESIHKQLVRRENALRPFLKLSRPTIDLGEVRFGEVVKTQSPVEIYNEGRVTAFVNIREADFPGWLSLDHSATESSYALRAGDSCAIGLYAAVLPFRGVSTALNVGRLPLSYKLSCTIQDTSQFSIDVNGRYVPTCLGTSLEHLATLCEPVRQHACSAKAVGASSKTAVISVTPIMPDSSIVINHMSNADTSSQPPATSPLQVPMPVPKEVWRLVDALSVPDPRPPDLDSDTTRASALQGALSSFLEPGDSEDVALVLDCLDNGTPIPPETPRSAVASTLLKFLRTLEDPVIPHKFYKAALDTTAICTAQEVRAALQALTLALPAVHANSLTYIAAFLRELVYSGIESTTPHDPLEPPSEGDEALRAVLHVEREFGVALLAPPPVMDSSPTWWMVGPDEKGESPDANDQLGARTKFVHRLIFLGRDDDLRLTFDI